MIVNGQVAEHGPHDELINIENGHYRKLVEKQEAKPATDEKEEGEEDEEEEEEAANPNDAADVAKEEPEAPGKEVEAEGGEAPQFVFKDVTFAYPTRKKHKVYNKFNLTIHKGETVAFVGPSGGGKRCVIRLHWFVECGGMSSLLACSHSSLRISLLQPHRHHHLQYWHCSFGAVL